MPKIVNTALKAKAWTFEAKATGPKAKAIKFGLEDYITAKYKLDLRGNSYHSFPLTKHTGIHKTANNPKHLSLFS